MHRPQWSSSGRLVGPVARAVHPVTAGAAVAPARRSRTATPSPARPFSVRVGVGFSGGDDEHPGHVVGAVAVLGPGLGEAGVLEGAATVRQPQQMVEFGRRRRGGHTSARRSARSRCARLQIRTRPPPATPSPAPIDGPRRPSRRRAAAASALGAGRTPARPDRRGRRRCPLHCRVARRRAGTRWPQRAGRSRSRRPEHRR